MFTNAFLSQDVIVVYVYLIYLLSTAGNSLVYMG